jgi:Protein of unknown function (DUF2852)
MTDTAGATTQDFGQNQYGYRSRGCAGRMNKKPWSIYEVGAVIGGFALFWPLGLVALFVKMKKGELWKGASEMQAPWANWQKHSENVSNFTSGWQRRDWRGSGFTGNAAFDDYRKAALEKLEAERRKLDEERHAFDEFLTKLRRAKDQEAFEKFMAEHRSPPTTEV